VTDNIMKGPFPHNLHQQARESNPARCKRIVKIYFSGPGEFFYEISALTIFKECFLYDEKHSFVKL